jgi:hypothetical protein
MHNGSLTEGESTGPDYDITYPLGCTLHLLFSLKNRLASAGAELSAYRSFLPVTYTLEMCALNPAAPSAL